MNNNNSTGVSYKTGFFLLIGFGLIAVVVASLIGLLILAVNSTTHSRTIAQAFDDPGNAVLMRWIQVVTVLIGFFLPAFIVARMLNRKPFQLLGYKRPKTISQFGIVVLIVLASLFFAGALGYLNQIIPIPHSWRSTFDAAEANYAKEITKMLDMKNFAGYLMSLGLIGLLPAVCEETLFRGGLQNFLTRASKKPWLAIIIVSIIFSLVHFSYYGFLPRMFLGIVLGLIYYTTGNIWLSITAHFLNNAIALTQVYVSLHQGTNIAEAMKETSSVYYLIGLAIFPVIYYLFKVLRSASQKNSFTTPDAFPTNNHGI